MNHHPHNSNAARQMPAQASEPARVSVGALAASSALLCSLLTAMPAHAFGPDRNGDRADREPPRREEARDHRDQRERDARSFERAEERRRIIQESGNADMSRRVDRMTPDERRDLRRQINEAGQEIYTRPQRR